MIFRDIETYSRVYDYSMFTLSRLALNKVSTLDMLYIYRTSLVGRIVKNLHEVQETWVPSLDWEDPL